jgi:hypothetical protein
MAKKKAESGLVDTAAEVERVIAAGPFSSSMALAEALRGEMEREVVAAWLVDARACQAVYQSGNVVSVSALQGLVNRAVGLLG